MNDQIQNQQQQAEKWCAQAGFGAGTDFAECR